MNQNARWNSEIWEDELFHADRHDEANSRFSQFFKHAKKNVTEVCATVEHIGTVKGNEQLWGSK